MHHSHWLCTLRSAWTQLLVPSKQNQVNEVRAPQGAVRSIFLALAPIALQILFICPSRELTAVCFCSRGGQKLQTGRAMLENADLRSQAVSSSEAKRELGQLLWPKTITGRETFTQIRENRVTPLLPPAVPLCAPVAQCPRHRVCRVRAGQKCSIWQRLKLSRKQTKRISQRLATNPLCRPNQFVRQPLLKHTHAHTHVWVRHCDD